MPNRHFNISAYGQAQSKKDLEVATFHWNIEMQVTSKRTEKSQHFHVAWGDIFQKMHKELGPQFCTIYGTRIRSDIFRAISDVTNPYYAIEQANAEFQVELISPQANYTHLKMRVRTTEYSCDIRIHEQPDSEQENC